MRCYPRLPFRPFRQLVALVLIPFYAVVWWVQERRCRRTAGMNGKTTGEEIRQEEEP